VCTTAGKGGVGKSSTVNSLLGEVAARVQAFKLQADAEIVTPFVKVVSACVACTLVACACGVMKIAVQKSRL
jgi:predicted GTPase